MSDGGKDKGTGGPLQCQEGSKGREKSNSTHTQLRRSVGGQHQVLAALPAMKDTWFPF